MLKIALGQMDIISGHPRVNVQKMLAMINQAKKQNVNLIIFPEMSIPGCLIGNTWEQQAFLRECEELGSRIIEASEGIDIIFGNVAIDWEKRGNDGRPRKYNACFVAQNGSLVSPDSVIYPFFVKNLQPNYREFDDASHFYSLRQLAADMGKDMRDLLKPVKLTLNGQDVRTACCICEDVWNTGYTTEPVPIFKNGEQVDLVVNIASSPFTTGKNNNRNRLFQEHAKNLNAHFIYVNNVGLQNNGKTVYTFDGCSSVYDCDGRLTHCCSPFQEELAVAAVHLDLASGRPAEEVRVPDGNNISNIFQTIDYAIPKFLNTTRQTRVVIGASGGIDSAVSAALYARAVGAENLLLVNMPSRFNSTTTKNSAKELADNLGCLYTVMPIDNSVENTVSQISRTPVISSNKGVEFNLTLTPFMTENIQARDRSARLLAGIAAAFGAVFTCNANKSEMTVGYSTLYGDQAGFFAVIADLWKHQVYELANYLNQSVYGRQVIPQSSIDLVPSAELSSNQNVDKGQGDPFIYPYHDYLFRSFIEEWNRAAPEDILSWYMEGVLEEKIGCEKGLVSKIFKTADEFVADLERWWSLHTGLGIAKRIQAPPVLALSSRAYGFDYRESQNGTYYTQKYLRLKAQLCRANSSGEAFR